MLHSAVRARAAACPAAAAVLFDDACGSPTTVITYAELLRDADALSSLLAMALAEVL